MQKGANFNGIKTLLGRNTAALLDKSPTNGARL